MFLPHQHRILSIAVLGYVAWIFTSTGAVVAGGGALLALEGRIESALLLPLGLFFLQVGAIALGRSAARLER